MTYTWTTSGGNFVNQTNPLEPVVDAPGAYTLLITSTVNGCTTVQTVNVPQDITPPIAAAGNDGLLTCAITNLNLNGNGSSQNGNYFYQWSTTNGQIIVGANGLTPTIGSGGTYTLVVANNDNGCTSTDNVLVNVNTQPPVVAIATPGLITCTVPQITLNGNGSQGGANITYVWTTTNGNIVGGTTGNTLQVNAAGNYTLTVLNNTNGCTANQTVAVTDNIVLPNADAGPEQMLTCTIDQVTLQGAGSGGANFAYAWTTAGGQFVSGTNSLQPVVSQTGTYTLLVTNTTTGCTQTDVVTVLKETNVPTGMEVDLLKPSCKDNDGAITFGVVTGGVGPYLYSIDGGQTYSPAVDFAQITPGTYDLWIQDVNGCEYQENLLVPQAPDPGISMDPSFSIELGDSLQLQAVLPPGYPLSLVDTIIWTPLDGLTFESMSLLDLLSPTAKPFKPTQYTVELISKDGCQAEDRVLIRVDNEPHIYIPNAFSPWNEDGDNDVFHIFADGKQIVQVNKFQVFDRWGEMVFTDANFQPNDPAHGWDGRLKGQLMIPAVFVYYAEILLIDGRVLLYKGDVTLVR
jgi:gliding motility-associated-like protein